MLSDKIPITKDYMVYNTIYMNHLKQVPRSERRDGVCLLVGIILSFMVIISSRA